MAIYLSALLCLGCLYYYPIQAPNHEQVQISRDQTSIKITGLNPGEKVKIKLAGNEDVFLKANRKGTIEIDETNPLFANENLILIRRNSELVVNVGNR